MNRGQGVERSHFPRGARTAGLVAFLTVLSFIFGIFYFFAVDAPLHDVAKNTYFSQSWRLFAPNVIKTNRELEVQARWLDDSGEVVESEWLGITRIELGAITKPLIPVRVAKSSRNALEHYEIAFTLLDPAQKQVVQAEGPAVSAAALESAIARAYDGEEPTNFLNHERMLTSYTGYFAAAYWGQDPIEIRWRVIRQRSNDFEFRFDPPQYDRSVVEYGWRELPGAYDPQVVEVYRDVIERYGPQS